MKSPNGIRSLISVIIKKIFHWLGHIGKLIQISTCQLNRLNETIMTTRILNVPRNVLLFKVGRKYSKTNCRGVTRGCRRVSALGLNKGNTCTVCKNKRYHYFKEQFSNMADILSINYGLSLMKILIDYKYSGRCV